MKLSIKTFYKEFILLIMIIILYVIPWDENMKKIKIFTHGFAIVLVSFLCIQTYFSFFTTHVLNSFKIFYQDILEFLEIGKYQKTFYFIIIFLFIYLVMKSWFTIPLSIGLFFAIRTLLFFVYSPGMHFFKEAPFNFSRPLRKDLLMHFFFIIYYLFILGNVIPMIFGGNYFIRKVSDLTIWLAVIPIFFSAILKTNYFLKYSYLYKALYAYYIGNKDETLVYLKMAHHHELIFSSALEWIVNYYIVENQFEKAIIYSKRLIELKSPKEEWFECLLVLIEKSESYVGKFKIDELISIYTKYFNYFPKSIVCLVGFGTTYFEIWKMNRNEESRLLAINYFEEALIINPKIDECYVHLINISLLSNEKGQSIHLSESYVRSFGTAHSYYVRGFVKQRYEQFPEALEDFNESIRLDNKNSFAYQCRATLLVDQFGDYSSALQDYNMLLELNPSDLESYKKRGVTKFALKDFKGAILDHEKAVEEGNKDPLSQFYFNLASEKINQYSKNYYEEKNFSIYASSSPAMELDGDFYYIEKNDSLQKKFFFLLADVQGKGHKSAIIAHSILEMLKAIDGTLTGNLFKPFHILKYINTKLIENTGGLKRKKKTQFVTAILGNVFFEEEKGKTNVLFSNAGHLSPIHFRNNSFLDVALQGDALNVNIESNYEDILIELEPDDILIFYTDGFTEQLNSYNEFFNLYKVKEHILKNKDKDINVLVKTLIQEVLDFGEGKQHDDLTILGIKAG